MEKLRNSKNLDKLKESQEYILENKEKITQNLSFYSYLDCFLSDLDSIIRNFYKKDFTFNFITNK